MVIETLRSWTREEVADVMMTAGSEVIADLFFAMLGWAIFFCLFFFCPKEAEIFLRQQKDAVHEDALEEEGREGLILEGASDVACALNDVAAEVEPLDLKW